MCFQSFFVVFFVFFGHCSGCLLFVCNDLVVHCCFLYWLLFVQHMKHCHHCFWCSCLVFGVFSILFCCCFFFGHCSGCSLFGYIDLVVHHCFLYWLLVIQHVKCWCHCGVPIWCLVCFQFFCVFCHCSGCSLFGCNDLVVCHFCIGYWSFSM